MYTILFSTVYVQINSMFFFLTNLSLIILQTLTKYNVKKAVLSGSFDRCVTPLLISRFASFVASGQHIPDEEVKIYENDPTPWLTSDSDGNDSDQNNELY